MSSLSEIKYSSNILEIDHIYKKCRERFGAKWSKGLILTYGNTIYFDGEMISEDLKAHESTHVRQQTEIGKDNWWRLYFEDPKFRLSQEIEAYRNQINYVRMFGNRDRVRFVEKKIYKDMAGMYGGMCTKEEAKELLNSK